MSAVLEVTSPSNPRGENVVTCEYVAEPPAGMEKFQLIPAPLSRRVVQAQVSGNGAWEPIASQTISNSFWK
jgi:hypothetical protein